MNQIRDDPSGYLNYYCVNIKEFKTKHAKYIDEGERLIDLVIVINSIFYLLSNFNSIRSINRSFRYCVPENSSYIRYLDRFS